MFQNKNAMQTKNKGKSKMSLFTQTPSTTNEVIHEKTYARWASYHCSFVQNYNMRE
jgi:hypothetical protein